MKLTLTTVVAALALSACQTTAKRVDQEIGAGQPAEYKEGYAAGCDSGYVAAGHPYYRFSKDVRRHASDALYKAGWDDGFSICKGQYESIGRSLR